MQVFDFVEQCCIVLEYDVLFECEQEVCLSSSFVVLCYYECSGYFFVVEGQDDYVCGYVLVQSVWQGDCFVVFVWVLVFDDVQDEDMCWGLLCVVVKSVYDVVVYEVYLLVMFEFYVVVWVEEVYFIGQYVVIYFGICVESVFGKKLWCEG